MKQSLTADSTQSILSALKEANQTFHREYPGVLDSRQPVHTVYGGAQIFSAEAAQKMGKAALGALQTYAPRAEVLARALGEEGNPILWETVYSRIVEKLKSDGVEDFRIDFEDGYGNRPDAEEDGHAETAAMEVAKGMKQRSLPAFIGIRIKPFNEENVHRSVRTLDIFLTTLLTQTGGKLPSGFVVTLPKITMTEQSRTLAKLFDLIESKSGLPSKTLKFELMVETPQAILDSQGRIPLRQFVDAGEGRCIGAHFGTYDYTAGCNITAAYQTMGNPVCNFAKHVMQVSLAGSAVLLSDGATNIMPIGPHRETLGKSLTQEEFLENEAIVHRAWKLSYRNIRHSLETGFYQGWDLHPAQLPVRYAAVYAFFLETLDAASLRLKSFVEKAAKATLLGDVFDDAATGQGLLNFFLRGISCGAITIAEAERTGLTLQDFRGRSFLKILQRSKGH